MGADRVLGDVQPGSNLVGAEVLVEQQENLHLAGRELAGHLVGNAAHPTALSDTVEESARDGSGQCRLAVCDPTKEQGNALGWLALQEVARRAGTDRLEQVLVGSRRCKYDDLALGRCLADVRQRRQPVHAGHRQVEEHQPRPKSPRFDYCLFAVRRLADDVEAVLTQEGGQRFPRKRVIVGDEDAFHVGVIGNSPAAE